MKNTELKNKLEALHSVGLDVVNSAVSEAIEYIGVLETQEPAPNDKLVKLEAEVASANAGIARFLSALVAIQNSDLENKDDVLRFFA